VCVQRFGRVAIFAVLIGVMTPQLAAASTTASRNREEFCQDEARLYAAPAQLATMWPDVTSTRRWLRRNQWSPPSSPWNTCNSLTGRSPHHEDPHERDLRRRCGRQKQFEEAMFFSPGFNASHSAKAEAGYTALIEKSARTVKTFLASEASVLVGYCRNFNDTRNVDAVAVGTTNSAQTILRADDSTTVTAAILKKAAAEAPHYVLFVSLSGHGAAEKAHYRVAAITGMVNACTTVPPSCRLSPSLLRVDCVSDRGRVTHRQTSDRTVVLDRGDTSIRQSKWSYTLLSSISHA